MKVLLTRNEQDCQRSAGILTKLGYQPIILPLSKTVETENELPEADYDGLIFTSVKAVNALIGKDEKKLFERPAYAVGPNTALALRNAGFTDVIVGDGDASQLAKMLIDSFSAAPAKLLYPCGSIQSFDMKSALQNTPIDLVQIALYATNYLDPGKETILEALQASQSGCQLHYSSASAAHFYNLARNYEAQSLSKTMDAIAISKKTSLTVDKSLISALHIASTPTQEGMLEVLQDIA